jgi:hypothetical protein
LNCLHSGLSWSTRKPRVVKAASALRSV